MTLSIKAVMDDMVAEVIDGIIEERGREVVFTLSSGMQNCITCSGLDPFCNICDGTGKWHAVYEYPLTGLVRWRKEDKRVFSTQGQYVDGLCTVLVSYNAVTSGSVLSTNQVMLDTRYLDVDDKRLVVKYHYREGSPLNRVYIICDEDESLVGTRTT